MQIYGFDRYGGPEVEGFFEVPGPAEGPGAILVQAVAAGVNPADIKVRSGARQRNVEVRFPMAMGREAAGTVIRDPAGAFGQGDLVFGMPVPGTGALAELVLLDAAQATRVPDGVDPVAAACIPIAIGTAWDALVETGVGAGDTVLVVGAGGGVGIHTCQLARLLGAAPLGLARATKRDILSEHDVPHVVADPGWPEAVRDLAPDGVDVVLDTVGGDALRAAAGLVKDSRRLRSIADVALAGELGGGGVIRRREARVYEELARLIAAGRLTPVIDRVHPFADAAAAVRHVASGHGSGKTVVTW